MEVPQHPLLVVEEVVIRNTFHTLMGYVLPYRNKKSIKQTNRQIIC